MATPTDDNETFKAAVARMVDRTEKAVGDLSERVGEIDDLVDARVGEVSGRVDVLAGEIEQLARRVSPANSPAHPVSWFAQSDPGEARAILADLGVWVAGVFAQYHDSVLRACWPAHPAVVEELLVLRRCHAEAFGERGSWSAASDWHERQRPGVWRRVKKLLEDCYDDTHTSGEIQLPLTVQQPSLDAISTASAQIIQHSRKHTTS